MIDRLLRKGASIDNRGLGRPLNGHVSCLSKRNVNAKEELDLQRNTGLY